MFTIKKEEYKPKFDQVFSGDNFFSSEFDEKIIIKKVMAKTIHCVFVHPVSSDNKKYSSHYRYSKIDILWLLNAYDYIKL